ncbi:Flavin-dependent oxidoreductase, luciferase family (includes alkanesulfonate monooxygenase SsuD and methylene tetrahydromethanopterin reductase) [Streptomyces zhaozhouensis]|uniref:Flavin-dependent oxidoreductase, luciferase family (Includes alkanesulfonate monooxygenase SsuD and methylene tetrahydromethanopterin reductase) n=1 Tax=Streptomyces zhaozhouensis TaxID=1300267 RepID=A0A286DT48_9ACTN|nr:LLM class flavin-dependent oxidoreductase [Streptomyces zhaozhouensis]SOD61734.1 Flavin-dependent oxidoreductase, luciferase family (includes alkanesulfonate monooxygenase SsuD and methylene tetrahydromethanopterin reductase) [Streptomyces zhaozhouensis]
MSCPVGVLAPGFLDRSTLVTFAQRAERLGFDSLWIVEDCFLNGGIAQAATVLASTERITVGIGLLPAGARNPAFAAMEVATLAGFHPGRLVVSVGHGMPDWMRQVGAWPASPLTLLGEYLAALRALLAGERVTVSGRHVRLDGVRLAAPPARPPLVLGGVRGPRSLALSGREADGTLLAEPVSVEYLAAARERIAAEGDHPLIAYTVAAVDEDPAVARDHARDGLKLVGQPDWAPHLAPLPFADGIAALRRRCGSAEEFARALPDDWVDHLSVSGTPEHGRERVRVLHEAGADRLVMIPAGPDPLAALESLGRLN